MKFQRLFNRSPDVVELIDVLVKKAHECNFERSTVRQLLIPLFKMLVAEMPLPQLAEICAMGGGFEPVPAEYREAHLVTEGTNPWSAVFLSTHDSGYTMLQKIAVASLLADVCEMVVAITPQTEKLHGLMPMEVISCAKIEGFIRLNDRLTEQMGW